jgi:hypothetical protein
MRPLPVLLLLPLVVGGCGGGDPVDLSGVYRVDVAVESAPCGADTPTISPPAYVKLGKESLFGQQYFDYATCTDAAGTDCAGGGLFSGFFEPIDDGWRGVVTSSSGSGGSCSLGYFEQTAILTDGMLVIEASTYRDTVDLAAEQCQPEEAERRGDTMPCEEHTRVDATRQASP